VYDAALESAVREFQRSHGLRDDGLVGPETRTALNVSAAARLSQIEIGLERQRWLPADLGPVHVLVRIPAFELDVVERGRPELSMRIIGGRPDWRTPIFSARISSVVLSPYWNIPASIAAREVVPAARRDPGYLDRNEIRVVSGYGTAERTVSPRSIDWGNYDAYRSGYRLRQEPGPQNPLGGVKFLFPNAYNVYLHDTPGKDLFAEPERAFSHGCMRVEKPLEMAEYLLRGLGWNRARIEEVIARRVERSVALPEPVPVHILYQTVWVDADGRVHFRKDLYGYDQRLARARLSTIGEISEQLSGDCPTAAAVGVPLARSQRPDLGAASVVDGEHAPT
jgi:murein L,D-transpeptidase YcbB/YkuD